MLKYFKKTNGLAKIMLVFEGSNTETPDELGCTHFLEHLMCKRMDKHQHYMNQNAILFNASTGNKYTFYWIEGLDKRIKKFAKTFIKEMSNQNFDISVEVFNNEKKIILQEYDEVMMDEEEYLLKRFYFKQGLGETVGNRNIIKNFSFKQMKELYKKNHKYPVYCLVEHSSKWKIENKIDFKEHYESPWLVSYDTSRKKPITYPPSPQSPVLITTEEYSSDFGAHFLIQEMLTASLTSPLMKVLREEEQLTYGVYSEQNALNNFVYYTSFSFNVATEKVEYAKEKFFETLESDWMTKQYFKETKKMLKLLLKMQLAQEDEDSSPAMLYLNSNILLIQEQVQETSFKKLKKIFKEYYNKDKLICLN